MFSPRRLHGVVSSNQILRFRHVQHQRLYTRFHAGSTPWMPSRFCSIRTKSVVLVVSLHGICHMLTSKNNLFVERHAKKHVCVSRVC